MLFWLQILLFVAATCLLHFKTDNLYIEIQVLIRIAYMCSIETVAKNALFVAKSFKLVNFSSLYDFTFFFFASTLTVIV